LPYFGPKEAEKEEGAFWSATWTWVPKIWVNGTRKRTYFILSRVFTRSEAAAEPTEERSIHRVRRPRSRGKCSRTLEAKTSAALDLDDEEEEEGEEEEGLRDSITGEDDKCVERGMIDWSLALNYRLAGSC